MSEMIERVARAICAFSTKAGREAVGRSEDQNWALLREVYRSEARAVIEAMRDPPISMQEAGAEGSGEDSIYVASGAWEAMIDEALKP